MIRVLISVELGPYGPVIFFFNDTATTEIYTLSLHDALPIYERTHLGREPARPFGFGADLLRAQLGEHHHHRLDVELVGGDHRLFVVVHHGCRDAPDAVAAGEPLDRVAGQGPGDERDRKSVV